MCVIVSVQLLKYISVSDCTQVSYNNILMSQKHCKKSWSNTEVPMIYGRNQWVHVIDSRRENLIRMNNTSQKPQPGHHASFSNLSCQRSPLASTLTASRSRMQSVSFRHLVFLWCCLVFSGIIVTIHDRRQGADKKI